MLKIFFFILNYVKAIIDFNGVYKIKSLLNNKSVLNSNNLLILSNESSLLFNYCEFIR